MLWPRRKVIKKQTTTVNMDDKQRICLTRLLSKEDPKALTSLMKGINDVEEGRITDLGSFAKYATEDDEDED